MNENQRKRIIHHLAAERVPGEINLWPAIREHFETSKQPVSKGDFSMNQMLARRHRISSAFLLALLLVTVLLFATPQGRAWAQEVLQFFARANTDRLPVQTWQLTPAPENTSPDPASIIDANQPVTVVEQQAGFEILEPAWLPENLSFVGASLEI